MLPQAEQAPAMSLSTIVPAFASWFWANVPLVHVVFVQIWGALFVYAGLVKLVDFKALSRTVADYQVLPTSLVVPVARILSWVEVCLGIALMAPLSNTFTCIARLLWLSSFLALFAGVQAINLIRGRAISCGCFGSFDAERLINWRSVAINLICAGLSLLLVLGTLRLQSTPMFHWGDVFVRLAATSGLIILLAWYQQRVNNSLLNQLLIAPAISTTPTK